MKRSKGSSRRKIHTEDDFQHHFGMEKKAVLVAIIEHLRHKHPGEVFESDELARKVNEISRKLWHNELSIDDLLAHETN